MRPVFRAIRLYGDLGRERGRPGPIKAAVALLAKAGPELRLPLAPVADANLIKIREAMVRFGLVKLV